MSSTQQVLATGPAALNRPRRRSWRGPLHGSELAWAIAFVVYPVTYGLWRPTTRRFTAT
jgi:hypothetical protein